MYYLISPRRRDSASIHTTMRSTLPAQLVNDSKDWLAVHDLNIVKRYKEAELEIVFEFRVRPQRDKFISFLVLFQTWGSGILK